MFIKNTLNLLVEAANMDLQANTEGVLTESQIKRTMNSFEEASEYINITAQMVPVVAIGEDYMVDINGIMPFMTCNNIKSVAEALDLVAEANNLPEKAVGMLIESDEYVNDLLEKANAKYKKDGNKKAKNKVLDKISKSTSLAEKLKNKGYTVKKKRSKTEECGSCEK